MIGTYTISYSDILRTMHASYDELHRAAVEAEIRALPHHVYRILEIHEQLQRAWQDGDTEAEDQLRTDLRPHEEAYYSLAKRLGSLPPEDVELLSLIYERRLPLRTVGRILYCDASTVLRRKNSILDRL